VRVRIAADSRSENCVITRKVGMKKSLALLTPVLLLAACSSHHKIDATKETQVFANPPITPPAPSARKENVAAKIEESLRTFKLFNYPEISLELVASDTAKVVRLVKAAGGRVLYDPNLGVGTQIPFVVATLPPAKLVDKDFVNSLGLTEAHVAAQGDSNSPVPIFRTTAAPDGTRDLYVPWADIKIPELRARKPGEGLGEGVKIAVIDTGVDASHPAMEDRVIYWADHTQQTRTPLEQAKLDNGKIVFDKDFSITVPDGFDPAGPFYVGVIDEQSLAVQTSEADRDAKNVGLDINHNGSKDDVFPVVVGKEKGGNLWVAYVGTSGGDFSAQDLGHPIADFNDVRAARACRGQTVADHSVFLEFPSRNRRLAYPLLIERDGNVPTYLSLGMDLIDHGTHVAGIAAGHGLKVEGAAPKAQIMSLKVCSGWRCTDEAITRALVDAFFNPYGCIPDVVNMSLGATLTDSLIPRDALLRDLAAKFGATFFISAANNGPGYRTLNGMGASGPAIMVGASVSRDAFMRHYNASPSTSLPDQMLFFFSSMGPSFTGLLRPHIAAPGSALSSIPLADGGYEMMQGTSMSSPLAAGSSAALLSLVKKAPEYEKYAKMKEQKIRQVLHPEQSNGDSITLQQFPLALRAALEESAHRMKDYTDPQQGYGLIDLNAAYDLFLQKLKNVDRLVFGEYAVNGNSFKDALYNRIVNPESMRIVQLDVVEDKEAAEQDVVNLRGTDLHVNLDSVDVQDTLGHVQHLTDQLPFSLVQLGETAQEGRSATLVLGNPVANFFRSLRKLDLMEPGKTYLAHYSVSREGQVVETIEDIVHKPITLGDAKATYDDLSGLSVEPITKTAAFVKKAQVIKAGEVHRYPIALTTRDQGFSVKVGIPNGVNGALGVTVTAPNGQKLLDNEVATRQPGVAGTPLQGAPANAPPVSPIAKGYVNTNGNAGIFEVTVTATGARWLSDSQYDLMVVADRLRVSKSSVVLSTSSAKSDLPHQASVTIMNSSRQAGKLDLKIGNLARMEHIDGVQIVPHQWTFRRIHLPEAPAGVDSTSVDVSFGDKLGQNAGFNGRIDNHLYAISDDGNSFTPVYLAEAPEGVKAEEKLFKNVKLNGQALYVAIETQSYLLGEKGEPTGDLDILYADVPVAGQDGLKAEFAKTDSTKDVVILNITAPAQLGGSAPAAGAPAIPMLYGELQILMEGSENPKPYTIPVIVAQ
jgi:tripeptidyl-peptidase II